MSLMTRPVAGESLASHVGGRMDGAPIASTGLLLTRLGLGNPWSGEGSSDARANARAAREARLEDRLHRFDRAPVRAGRRMWPGESRSWSFNSFHLGESSMVVPLMPRDEEVEEVEEVQGTGRARRPRGPGMRPVANPWHSVSHAPARVVRGGGQRGPAQRTARVSRGGSVRFEPSPRRSSASRMSEVAAALEPVVATAREAQASPAAAERRAADLVREQPVQRSARTPRAVSSVPAASISRRAGFSVASDAPARRERRPMQRLGDRVAAVLGPVAPPAPASGSVGRRSARESFGPVESTTRSGTTVSRATLRSEAVRTAAGSPAATAVASSSAIAEGASNFAVGSSAQAQQPAPAASVRSERRQSANAPGPDFQGSATQGAARRRLARARAAEERAVLGPALARAAQSSLTRHLDDTDVRPLSLAAGRVSAPTERRRGLRPVFRHSPLMAVVQPELAEEAVVEAEQAPVRRLERAPVAGPRVVRGFGPSTGSPSSTVQTATSRAASSATPFRPAVAGSAAATADVGVSPRTSASLSSVGGAAQQSGAVVAPPSRAARQSQSPAAISRGSGTAWVARRLSVGTSAAAAFRPSVMTRHTEAASSTSPLIDDGAPVPAMERRTRVASTVSSAAVGGPGLPATPSGVGAVEARPVETHAASVFRRMEAGQAAPGSSLPVAVPRRTRTGLGRSLFLSVPEAVVPQAAAEPEVTTEEVQAPPRRRPTESPRVVRSPSRSERPDVVASKSARAAQPAPSRSAAAPVVSAARSSASAPPSVMDFGSTRRPAAARTASPTERLAAQVPSAGTGTRDNTGVVQTPFGPLPVGTGVVPPTFSAPVAAAAPVQARAVARAARPSLSVHRAIEVAASRAEPMERSRSLLPRRPRLAGEATAERASFAPAMADGRPVVSAASRMSPTVRRASGGRITDDAAVVRAAEVEAPVESTDAPAVVGERGGPTTRVVRAPTRVERLGEQATGVSASNPSTKSPAEARGLPELSSSVATAASVAGATDSASTGRPSPVQQAATRTVRPSASTQAFARSARALADSASTPERVSSVLHAAARAALDGKHDTVERLLRVADTAAKREEAARSLLPKVSPRHESRSPSMWSSLRSPVDSAVALATAPEAQPEEAGETARVGRSASTVPVVRGSGRRASSVARSARPSASVQAFRRNSVVPVTTDSARAVLRTAPPAVRARVKALLSRRSRPSALGYARLADVDEVLQAVSRAVAEVSSAGAGAPSVDVVRDVRGRQRLSRARQQAMASGARPSTSRPSDWAGARTATAVSDPDPRIRRAVSTMSVFRTALGELSLPSVAGPDVVVASSGNTVEPGERQGRHVLRTADGRFVSPALGRASAVGGASAARSGVASTARVSRSAYGVDTDTVVRGESEAAGVSAESAAPVGSSRSSSDLASVRPESTRVRGPRPVYAARPGLQATLGEVDEHSGARHELPVWARRASGSPLVRSSEQREVVQALARAHTPEQVVQVITQAGADLSAMPASLPAPVLQVIEQVREGARQDLEARFKAAREAAGGETAGARSAPTPQKPASAEPELLRAVRGLKRRRGASSSTGVGEDRVMKLARKLQSLIHLAEGTGDRNEARRHVRMAENSAAARAEGQGATPGGSTESGKRKQVDIEALVTEVVQSVNRELALRRERRQEDPDGGNWW